MKIYLLNEIGIIYLYSQCIGKNKEIINDMLKLEKELVYDGCKKVLKRKEFTKLINDIGIININIDKYFSLPMKSEVKNKKKLI
jgi:hypothetical protein